jgi:hypothetical protein
MSKGHFARITAGDSFKGAVYRPDAKQEVIDKDSCCKS